MGGGGTSHIRINRALLSTPTPEVVQRKAVNLLMVLQCNNAMFPADRFCKLLPRGGNRADGILVKQEN